MINYIGCQEKSKLKKIFLVHGEEQTQLNFKQTLNETGWKRVEIPEFRQEVEL